MAIIGGGLISVAGGATALIIHTNAMNAQAEAQATSTLNMDLIQAQAGFEGWKQEAAQGNLSSADYRVAFANYLAGVQGNLTADMHSF